ncbi:MAG: hypothetical protein QM642_06130, partial [Edaphocola sp.]
EEIVSEVDAWQQHRNNKNGKSNGSLPQAMQDKNSNDFIRKFMINITLKRNRKVKKKLSL